MNFGVTYAAKDELSSKNFENEYSQTFNKKSLKHLRDNKSKILTFAAFKNPRKISAGSLHTCALDDEGVKCWGGD